MPLAGWLIVRNGSRRITLWAAVAFILVVPFMALVPSYGWLFLVMPLAGMSTGSLDVAMNAQAVSVEDGWGSPITSSFHAAFSLGMFLGAGYAALNVWLGLDVDVHLLGVSALMLLTVYGCRNDLIVDGPAADEAAGGGGRGLQLGHGILLLGLAALCCMIGEGAMADWTPLYMTRVAGSPESLAPLGQAAFSGAMVVSRTVGDWVRGRLGSGPVIRGGALLALGGLALAVLLPYPWLAILGFGLVGLGLGNVVPIVFSTAGRVPGLAPGVGISSVSTVGYAGFLVGPPVIGFVADWQNETGAVPGAEGLRVGLGVVLLLFVILLGLGIRIGATSSGPAR